MMTEYGRVRKGVRKAQEALVFHLPYLLHVGGFHTQGHYLIEKEMFTFLKMPVVYSIFQIYKGKDWVNSKDFDCVWIEMHF